MQTKLFSTIYLIVLCAECFAVFTNNFSVQLFTKNALMPILIVYFLIESKNLNSLKYLILSALFFSWIGDFVLLIDKYFGNLFVFGLVSFLIAHLFYIFYFWKVRKLNSAENSFKLSIFIAVFAYTGILYFILFPYLGAMKIPVLIYSTIISLMLLASFHAFESTQTNFAKLCLLGTLFFVVSDSLLAINRFAFPQPIFPVLVMLTYGLAQLFITLGSVKNLQNYEKRNDI
ncbi:MAG TPA: lysoplasmalogenase [Pyrinomonadaceae bacterium]|nr:lysoplasmalogenase [Pyrinomonadaceae bacterium]